MTYEPLHHKYRPQTFKDLVGQQTISLTLSNALKQAKIAPAYLFTGPRGTGKTSSARILAKSLNCLNYSQPTPEPCGKCEVCRAIANGSALDVIEIDAASNTGVDNIREIIDRSRFAPVQCRYKVYVIDECHMLSSAAFNALLKTLEEPPPQVVFVLATTDPQRVLSTIISRCQRFDYRRIPIEQMCNHLTYIAQMEKIAITPEAIALIAQIANGGLRDAESLLDQLSLFPDEISVAKVWDLVGAVPEQDLLQLLEAVKNNNSIGILQQCRSLLDRGREPLVVLQNLASFYLNLLIAKTAPQSPDLVAVTETCWQQLCSMGKDWDINLILYGQQQLKLAEAQLKQTTQPRLWLEITLLGLIPNTEQPIRYIQPAPAIATSAKTTPDIQPAPAIATEPKTAPDIQPAPAIATEPKTAPVQPPTSPPPPPKTNDQHQVINQPVTPPPVEIKADVESEDIWQKVVSRIQPPTTQALLKQQCHLVSFDGFSAIVGISTDRLQKLHQGKVSNIEAAFFQVCQRKIRVQLEVANAGVAKDPVAVIKSDISLPVNHATAQDNKTDIVTPIIQESKVIPLRVNNATVQDLKSDIVTPIIQESKVISLPVNHATVQDLKTDLITPIIQESEFISDDFDPDLQKAIDKLTASFEGELVRLDSTEEQVKDISVTELIADLTREELSSDEYEDEDEF
ncbi:DNA polymerase III subunit gamma/tau [Chondrocystis sp. NIES-4102]|nr:DNA polymerase III subunit gamma/tau [Chondrocystis sp. NIES-4102]